MSVVESERRSPSRPTASELGQIVSQLRETLLIVDANGRMEYAAGGARELFGRETSELVGRYLGLPVIDASRGSADLEIIGAHGPVWVEMRAAPIQWRGNQCQIITLRDVTQRRETQRRLRGSLIDTIHTLARTIEARDPYTAGHQSRVGQLALAIGRSLGWDTERLLGLNLAALVHDVGKILVPIEILTRPGRLSAEEFAIIKEHSTSGHSILRDIDVPWPVAEVAHQHHERMDGSGYPQGLSGQDILPEAQIIAVADVVEAITADRPYRPGKGIEAGLDCIESGRGGEFAENVVDACVNVVRSGDFKWQASPAQP